MALVRMPLIDTGAKLIGKSVFEMNKTIRRNIRESNDGTRWVRLGDFAYNRGERDAYVTLDYFVISFCTDFEVKEA